MESSFDYRKFAILYVDDEEKSLKYFTRAFEDKFKILTAKNAQDGFALLDAHKDEVALLLSDQQMPGEKGVQLLERARQIRPRILRFLVTAYSDIDAAIDAVNMGAIYKYISKPWDVGMLEITLKRALEFFMVQRERDQLLREKMSALHNLIITDRVVSLGILAAGLGHHIRNSLVAIRTFLDLAPAKLEEETLDLERLRNPAFWKEFYAHVQAQVGRIVEMLSDLGQASERNSPLFESTVDVSEVVADTLSRMRKRFEEKGVRIELDLPPSLPKISVDHPKFLRLWELLLEDELTHVPSGGLIQVNARSMWSTRVNGEEVQVEVQDDGPGLPQESLRSVFDPFFLRHDDPKDFGIRLMTCFFIVHHHGGRIEVNSRRGHGTSFRLAFPVNPKSVPAIQEDETFVSKVLMNDVLWEKLLSHA